MTILQLRIMIACHYRNAEVLCINKNTFLNEIFTDEYSKLRAELIRDEMIEEDNLSDAIVDENFFNYKLTSKGRFWLDKVLSLSYPVSKWEIPEKQNVK